MGIFRRARRYLTRKKGKAIILFLLFLLVSVLLLTGFSILSGTDQAAKDLRSNIGAAFYIRPYEQLEFNSGQVSSTGTPTITQQSIDEVITAIGGELKAYNTEHYGYAKGEDLSFVPGIKHNEENNMGQVTAVRDSQLSDMFLNGDYELLKGRHIQPDDDNKILISNELAEENGLQVGDTIDLTHAEFGNEDGAYIDLIPQKTAFVTAKIVGIYEIKNSTDDPAAPTAAKAVNHIFSDSQMLVHLQEQSKDVYQGEIAFFIADPLHLDDMLKKVEAISSIDWENHILRENDFQYSRIAGQLQNMQNLVLALIVLTVVLSMIVLILILTMRIRGRIQEAGLLLAVGKTKAEIIGQFILETIIVLILGYILALLFFIPVSGILNQVLFGSLVTHTTMGILQTGGFGINYLHPNTLHSLVLVVGECAAILLAVTASSGAILSLKPKEILTKMS